MCYKVSSILLAICLMGGLVLVDTPAAEITVKLELAAEGLTAPMLLISPPDGTKRRFIVEQIGLIKILMPDGKIPPEPFLNIRHKLVPLLSDFDEEGLLSLAFHPDFKSNGKFYIAYSGLVRGDATLDKHLWYAHTNYVSEYKVSKENPYPLDIVLRHAYDAAST